MLQIKFNHVQAYRKIVLLNNKDKSKNKERKKNKKIKIYKEKIRRQIIRHKVQVFLAKIGKIKKK